MNRYKPKRMRPINACVSCRTRKIKCDKGQPCSKCSKYGGECVYQPFDFLPREANEQVSVGEDLSLLDSQEVEKQIAEAQMNIANLEKELTSAKSLVARSLEREISSTGSTPSSPFSSTSSSSTTNISSADKTPTAYLAIPLQQRQIIGLDDPVPFEFSEAERKLEVNIFDLYNPVKTDGVIRKQSPPLSWMSFINCDRFLNAMQQAVYKDLSLDSKLNFLNSIADAGCSEATERLFTMKYHDDEDLDDFKPIDEADLNPSLLPLGLETLNSNVFPMGDYVQPEFQLSKQICQFLPDRRIIDMLVDRFFIYLYPFIHVLDQHDFLNQVDRILKDLDRGQVVIKDKFDLTQIGILLIMLRLSYVSLYTCNKSLNESNLMQNLKFEEEDEDNVRFLLKHPIDLKAVDLSQQCLNKVGLFSTLTLSNLQLALMIRSYQKYGPEYILGSGENEPYSFDVIISILAQKLEVFHELGPKLSERERNLRRKIGAYLISLSLLNFGALNCVKNFKMAICNIQIPEYTKENSNNFNENTERITLQILSSILSPGQLYSDTQSLFENYSSPNFEKASQGLIDSYEKTFTPLLIRRAHDKYTICIINTLTIRSRLMRCFVKLSIKFHLYNSLEDRTLTHKLLDDMLQIIFKEMLVLCKAIFSKEGCFANTIDLIFIPSLIHLIHRVLLIITGMMIRLNLILNKFKRQSINNHYTHNCEHLLGLFNKTNAVFFKFLLNLSNRYYYGWRVFKTQNYFIRCINLLELRSIFKDVDISENFKFTNNWVLQISELITHQLNDDQSPSISS